jgi:putative effector of murein hydrolase
MTEKLEINGRSESLFDKIWRRLIQVIPFLLLSTLIAFFMFKILSDKLGSNFFEAIALAIIGVVVIASLISIFVGYKYKSRDLGVLWHL